MGKFLKELLAVGSELSEEKILFQTRTGRKINRKNFARLLNTLPFKAGLSCEIHPHTARVSFIRQKHKEGIDIYSIWGALSELRGGISAKKYIFLKQLEKLKEKILDDHLSSSQIEDIVLSLDLHDKKGANVVSTGALLSFLKKIYKDLMPKVLVSDAAGEYKEILSAHQECWIHELRNYREIRICSDYVREELDLFFEKAWDLLDLMESYKFFIQQQN